MDYFGQLPEEITNHIMRYLSKADILELSLVSKRWYECIGKSKQCMNKLKVSCDMENFEDVAPILESRRLYQHFKFELYDENRKAVRNARAIVNKFSESIISIRTTIDMQRTSDLPKLKKLEYFYREQYRRQRKTPFVINAGGLIKNTKNLEMFFLNCGTLSPSSLKVFKEKIVEMVKLKGFVTDEESIVNSPRNFNV